ncbi:ABC transporter permease [Nocardioides sp. CN2-186]|uniref:ABC transporter permease n=1 Tax=Nocardioides tweenelious TaxID=3156607 RepID=UPI0032B317A7
MTDLETTPAAAPQAALPMRLRRRRFPASLRRPLALTGLTIVLFWVVVMIAAPWIASQDPIIPSSDLLQGPSGAHWFGTDQLGRDVFSRVVHASRVSLPLGFILVVIAVSIGCVVGAVSGFFGGWVDSILMRIVDIVFAFPAIILAMVVTAVLGPSLQNAVFALALVTWPTYARVVRGLVMSAGKAEYVQSVRLLGASSTRALRKDVAPNVVGPVLVLATLDIGNAVLLLAGLSFLGLGAQPPDPEWGAMVSEGTANFQAWWIGTFPGLAIFTVVLAFNFIGDSLRDAIDPRSSWGSGERS